MSSPAVPALFRRLLRSVDKRLTIPSARASASSEAEEAEAKDNASSSHSSSRSSSTASVREYIIEVAERLEANKAATCSEASSAGGAMDPEAASQKAMDALRDYVCLLESIHENKALIQSYNRPGEVEGTSTGTDRSAGSEAKNLAKKLGFKLPNEE